MNQVNFSSSGSNTIDLNGMDNLLAFSRYNPDKPESLLEGMELDEDLTIRFGTILYAKGTKFTPKHITRLIQLQESNPSLDFIFKLKRNAELIKSFSNEIKKHFVTLVNHLSKTLAFSNLLSQIDGDIDSFIDDILTDESITLSLFQARYTCQNSEKNRSKIIFDHSLNVALFSLAIASSEEYSKIVGKDKAKLTNIFKAGLFHNYGALNKIDTIMKAPEDKRFSIYWEANRNGYSSLDHNIFSFDIINAFLFLGNYYLGKKDFVTGKNWPEIIANIVLVAEAFLSREIGLFADPRPMKKVIDYLNIKVSQNDYSTRPVLALTKGLNLTDIFDFYKELNTLTSECPYDSGVAYPLTGFKSPTLFICEKGVNVCKHIDSSKKAVNLVKRLGKLKPGQYHICILLTNKLQSFYKKHYVEIKDIVAAKEKSF
jgi:hypothetical protein